MKWPLILSVIIAAFVASFALYAGIQHNPMGAFCAGDDLDECRFDYAYAAVIWLSWFVPVALASSLVAFFARFVAQLLLRR